MELEKELLKKHLHGQEKYHAFSFLKDGRKMSDETIEELVDGINYLTYQLIKDSHTTGELMRLSNEPDGVKLLNIIYTGLISEIPKMQTTSENKNMRAIAIMRDLIEELS